MCPQRRLTECDRGGCEPLFRLLCDLPVSFFYTQVEEGKSAGSSRGENVQGFTSLSRESKIGSFLDGAP